MKLTNVFNVHGKTSRELDAAAEEVLRDIAWCERHRREDYAVLTNIRKAVVRRRITRSNL